MYNYISIFRREKFDKIRGDKKKIKLSLMGSDPRISRNNLRSINAPGPHRRAAPRRAFFDPGAKNSHCQGICSSKEEAASTTMRCVLHQQNRNTINS